MIETIAAIGARMSAGALDISQKAGVRWYTGKDGLNRCVKCGKKLETMVRWPGYSELQKVNCVCDCGKAWSDEVRAAIDRATAEEKMAEQRAEAFGGLELARAMTGITFDKDRDPGRESSKHARIYVEKFPAVRRWLYYFGPPGTGKTWTAACIANALLEKGFTVRMATPQQLEAESWTDKGERFKRYLAYDLFILDDLGTERKTEYSYELIFRLIDDRAKAKKPMVITSNITAMQLSNMEDLKNRRISSRIMGMSGDAWYEFKGVDKRQ